MRGLAMDVPRMVLRSMTRAKSEISHPTRTSMTAATFQTIEFAEYAWKSASTHTVLT